jgi:hypothetical protein
MKFVIAIRTEVSNSVYEVDASTKKEALDLAKKMTMNVMGLPPNAIHMTAYGPYIKIDSDDVIRVPLELQDTEGNFVRGHIEIADTEIEIYLHDYPNAFFPFKSTATLMMGNDGLQLVLWGNHNGGPLIMRFDLLNWRDE